MSPRNYRIEGDCSIVPGTEPEQHWEKVDVKYEENKLKFSFCLKPKEVKEINIKYKKHHNCYYVEYDVIYEHC